MDGHKFDRIARSIADGSLSRRTLVRSGVAALVAAVSGALPGDRAEAARCRTFGQICRSGGNCCSGICLPSDKRGRRRCAKSLGERCAAGSECGSGYCADGVCCDAACTGQCEACNLAGRAGACSAVSGTPQGTRAACAGSGTCAGTCDGDLRKTCRYPGSSTSCGASACVAGDAVGSACDGAGSCTTATIDCGLYRCADGACKASCSVDGDCVPEAFCGAGVCRSDRSNGQRCERGEECVSGYCVDGVCCNGACTGQCQSCATGACVNVTGQPVGGRVACSGSGFCGGICTGSSADCTYKSGQSCGSSGCDSTTNRYTSAICTASGECATSSQSCGAYRCGANGCLSSCATDDSNCASSAYCDYANAVCKPKGGNGTPCDDPRLCASGFCDYGNGGVCAGILLTPGSNCSANEQCDSGSCANGVCACPSGQKLCRGRCIDAGKCCNASDCPEAPACQQAVCDIATNSCQTTYLSTDGRCPDGCHDGLCGAACRIEGDCPKIDCVQQSCVSGTCQPPLIVVKPRYNCNETVCNPTTNEWGPGAAKTCPQRNYCELGPGTCNPNTGECEYETRCAACEICDVVNGDCVNNCGRAQGCDGVSHQQVCNRGTGFCEFFPGQDGCGPCAFCIIDHCAARPDGTTVLAGSAGATCCGGAPNTDCDDGICPQNGVCCDAGKINVDGKCCPPGTRVVCTGAAPDAWECCETECYCPPQGLGCLCAS